MAQPALEKFIRRSVDIVIQPVAGTPTVPNPATDRVRFYDGSSGTEFDSVEENADKPFFSGREFTTYNHRAFVEGSIHVYPPAIPGDAVDGTPHCDTLLRVAGMAKVLDDVAGTTRYEPISDNVPLATADWRQADLRRRIYDARANISALMLEIGQRPKATVRLQGAYDAVVDEAMTAGTAPSELPPVMQASNSLTRITVLPGGAPYQAWGKSLTIDFGNTLTSKEYTEHRETSIDDRQARFTLRVSKQTLADFNPWALRRDSTFVALAQRLISADGRYVEFGVRGQIRDINEADIDGDYGWELSGPCVATSAGGDEFYVEFGTHV